MVELISGLRGANPVLASMTPAVNTPVEIMQ
jgi:hypothetical protein